MCGSAEICCCSENMKEPSELLEYFSLSGNVLFKGNMFSPIAAAIKRLLTRNKVGETHMEA